MPSLRIHWRKLLRNNELRAEVGEPSALDGSLQLAIAFITHDRCLTPLSDNWGRALEILWRALESMGRALGRHLGGALQWQPCR